MKKIDIMVAAHKCYQMPELDIYTPIHVGAQGKADLGYQRDDEGDNISTLNSYFCELTAYYYAWKNMKHTEIIGLVHYRRYFVNKVEKYHENLNLDSVVLDRESIEKYLSEADVIVPKKRHYYIESLYSHYANTLDGAHLDKTREIIAELTPEYLSPFDKVMKQTGGYMFNMLITDKVKFDAYCEWLFPILFELRNRIDETNLTDFELRLYGRVSELLLNVWLEKNQYTVKEVPFMYMDNINWFNKITSFLLAKFFKKKYKKSF